MRNSMLKNQTRCRAVSEDAAILVRYLSLSCADPSPTRDDLAFGVHAAGLRGDRANKRNNRFNRELGRRLKRQVLRE